MGELCSKMAAAAGCLLALGAPGAACADPAKDIQAAARVLTFLENGPAGRTPVGIVFDPAKPESVAEKNAVMAAIGAGYSAGAVTIVGRPMEPDAVAGVRVVFVTHGVSYAEIGAQARAKRIIAIGSDFACVRSGACAIGVSTEPMVQVVVNSKAIAAVGGAFRAAFRMMIHEI